MSEQLPDELAVHFTTSFGSERAFVSVTVSEWNAGGMPLVFGKAWAAIQEMRAERALFFKPDAIESWKYRQDAALPDWLASLAHDRDVSPNIFVRSIGGITEVLPGEVIDRMPGGGVRAQVVRATDAA